MTTATRREAWERTVLGAGWGLMPGGQSWQAGRHDVRRRPDGQFSCCDGGVFGDVGQLRLHLLENGPGWNHFDDPAGRIACMAATGRYVSPGDWVQQRADAELHVPEQAGPIARLCMQPRAPDCCQGCGMGAVETGLAPGWLPGERLCAYCAALEAERGGHAGALPAASSSWRGRLPEAARLAGAALLLAGLSLLILAMMIG